MKYNYTILFNGKDIVYISIKKKNTGNKKLILLRKLAIKIPFTLVLRGHYA